MEHAGAAHTRPGEVVGTPAYMSPEQCRGVGRVDARADIYSLGCILYAMVCGRPPFTYQGMGELLSAHLHEPPRSPSEVNPSLSPALDVVVARALAKDPQDRHQTTAELTAALTALPDVGVTTPGPLTAPPSPAPTVVLRPIGSSASVAPSTATSPRQLRSRRSVLLVGALGALAAGATVIAAWPRAIRDGGWEREPAVVPLPPPAAVPAPETPEPPPAVWPEKRERQEEPPPPRTARVRSRARIEPPASVLVKVTNAREGLTITVDGRRASLPLRLPADRKPHRVVFRTPNFRPEAHTLFGERDQSLTLENRPAFITQ
jgi:hypothetical protein